MSADAFEKQKRRRRIAEIVSLCSIIFLLFIEFVDLHQRDRGAAQRNESAREAAKEESDRTRDRLIDEQKNLEHDAMVFNERPQFTLKLKPAPRPCQ